MRQWTLRIFALATIAYGVGCGGLDGAGADSCQFSLVVLPEQPVRGDTIEIGADVSTQGELSGIEVVQWSVRYDGAPVTFEVTGANGDEVVFPATAAGVYNISVAGSLGGVECGGDARDLNVTEPGAVLQPMQLVIVPRTSSVVPPQAIDFQLPGGADYALSTLSLQSGNLVGATLRGPDSEPLAGAYLRAVPAGGAGPDLWVERFSQQDGGLDIRLQSGSHDVLVSPAGDLPALRMPVVEAGDLQGSIVVDAGATVTGTVTDPAGDPVAGASVQVTVGGAPSTLGTTNASGAFALKARAGGSATVTVTPSEASGLPALVLASGPAVADGSTVEVHYDAGLDLRTVSPVLRQTDGTTPAAGARVTFIARSISGAGTIAVDGASSPAAGELVRTAQASGSGVIPDQRLTNAQYDIIVEPGPAAPAGEGVRFALLDLRTGQSAPASLRLAAPGHLSGRVIDADDAPVAGATLVAAPVGLLARATTAGDATTTGGDGSFNLALAAGGSYQLRVDGPNGAGRVIQSEAAPTAPGGTRVLQDSELPATLRLTGALVSTGGGAVVGALIQLQCLDCGPGGGPATVAEAVSDASGEFAMRAPDPGVVAQ